MAEWTVPGPIRLYAPAKVNLSLEVLNRREDGFHDVVTLMETISLYDVIDIAPAKSLQVTTTPGIPGNDDLSFRALERLEQFTDIKLCLSVTVRKSIPVAAGLGGGSSDAGTLIGTIGRLLGLSSDSMHQIAAELGSDVPFFLKGGLALASGTGTDIKQISASGRRWYVIAVPDLEIPEKTATLYRALTQDDFSNGKSTRTLTEQLSTGARPDLSLRSNAFQRPLLEYPALRETVEAFERAGERVAMASGAGPSVFALCETFERASTLYRNLELPESTKRFLATSVVPGINRDRVNQMID